jgi:hypothetical protein
MVGRVNGYPFAAWALEPLHAAPTIFQPKSRLIAKAWCMLSVWKRRPWQYDQDRHTPFWIYIYIYIYIYGLLDTSETKTSEEPTDVRKTYIQVKLSIGNNESFTAGDKGALWRMLVKTEWTPRKCADRNTAPKFYVAQWCRQYGWCTCASWISSKANMTGGRGLGVSVWTLWNSSNIVDITIVPGGTSGSNSAMGNGSANRTTP